MADTDNTPDTEDPTDTSPDAPAQAPAQAATSATSTAPSADTATDITLPGEATVKTVTPTPAEQITGAMGAEQEANTAEGQAIANQASAQAQANANAANVIMKLPTQAQLVQQNQAKNDFLAQQFANQKIDPNRLYHNMSTAGKIEAGIGMLLSGFGSGASHQQNMAQTVMTNAINNDISAQKNSQDQAQTLWKMNREALGNEQAANLATQNQMLEGLKYKINSAATQYQGPIAIAQAQKANALIEQQKAINNQKLSLFGPATQDSPDPATRVGQLQRFGLVTPEQATASLKEIKQAQDVTALTPKLDDAFQRASSRNPVTSAQGQHELEGILNTTITETEGTARQAAFNSVHNNMVPSGPTAFPGENDNKLKTMHEYLASKAAAPFSKSIGVDLSQFPTTRIPGVPTQAPAAAPGSDTQGGQPMSPGASTSKSGRPIVNINGKWHYKGSGGS